MALSPKYVQFNINDSGGTLRSIPVSSIGGIGFTYDELDHTAFQDLVKNVLVGHPDFALDISGPWRTNAAAAAGTLSGSHTILKAIVGGTTPLSFDIQFGDDGAWTAGDQQFGMTQDGTNGVVVTSYIFDPSAMTYTATLKCIGGGLAPAWGTAAETAS